jgi:hypothetical protein
MSNLQPQPVDLIFSRPIPILGWLTIDTNIAGAMARQTR